LNKNENKLIKDGEKGKTDSEEGEEEVLITKNGLNSSDAPSFP